MTGDPDAPRRPAGGSVAGSGTASDDPEPAIDSALFTYGAPFAGVLLVAVGIAAAVPGGYALVQPALAACGVPTVAVDSPADTDRRFGTDPPATVDRVEFDALTPAERAALEAALSDPVGEARVGTVPPGGTAFRNGTLVTYRGERYYATIVADNDCVRAAPMQFPLGLSAILIGLAGVLTPPAYRRLVALETGGER